MLSSKNNELAGSITSDGFEPDCMESFPYISRPGDNPSSTTYVRGEQHHPPDPGDDQGLVPPVKKVPAIATGSKAKKCRLLNVVSADLSRLDPATIQSHPFTRSLRDKNGSTDTKPTPLSPLPAIEPDCSYGLISTQVIEDNFQNITDSQFSDNIIPIVDKCRIKICCGSMSEIVDWPGATDYKFVDDYLRGMLSLDNFYFKRNGQIIDEDYLLAWVDGDRLDAYPLIIGGNKNKKKNKDNTKVIVQVQNPPKKKNKKSKTPKLPRNVANRMPPMRMVRYSKCALKFALAIIDGFNPKCFGVCNPAGRESFTQKTRGFIRFIVTVGTNGFGGVLVSPSVSNDAISLIFSGSAFTGTSLAPFSANNALSTGNSALTLANLPYSAAYIANNSTTVAQTYEFLAGKVVAGMLLLQYIGTTLNMGGMYYGLHEPAHQSLSGFATADFGLYTESVIEPVSRRDYKIGVYPLTDFEDQFPAQGSVLSNNWIYPFNDQTVCATAIGSSGYTYSTAGGNCSVGCPVLGVAVTGVAGNQFQAAYIQHNEYTGRYAQSMVTKVEADPDGAAQVKVAVKDAAAQAAAENRADAETVWKYFKNSLMTHGQAIADMAVPAAISMIKDF